VTSHLVDKFWPNVKRLGVNECWPWIAAKTGSGYGVICQSNEVILAHRVSYVINVGTIPAGLCVLHRCDNPPCVNPLHLFIGTIRDNNIDCVRKGRSNFSNGESHCRSVLTERDVRHIKQSKDPVRYLGLLYGVHFSTIARVKRGEIWAHVK